MPRGVSRYDEAQLQRQLWTPAHYTGAGRFAWARLKDSGAASASAITLNVSSKVIALTDKWGLHNFSVAGAGPDLGTLNGSRALSYPGAAGTFLNSTAVGSAYTGPVTLFAVGTRTMDFGGNRGLVGTTDNFFGLTTTTVGSAYRFNAGWNGNEHTNTPKDFPVIGFTQFKAGTMMISGDGETPFSGVANVHSIGATAQWSLGAWSGGEEHSGLLGEAIILHAELPERDRQLFIGYLAWDWYGSGVRLADNHPYKNRPPLIGA